MANPGSEGEPSDKGRRPNFSETTRDFVYLLLSVGTALFAFGSIIAAVEELYSIAITNAVVAVILGYLSYRLSRIRRKTIVHNLNI